MKNRDGVTVVKEDDHVPSPERRTVNYAGKKVFIDEIERLDGPLEEGHELRKKIEYYKKKLKYCIYISWALVLLCFSLCAFFYNDVV